MATAYMIAHQCRWININGIQCRSFRISKSDTCVIHSVGHQQSISGCSKQSCSGWICAPPSSTSISSTNIMTNWHRQCQSEFYIPNVLLESMDMLQTKTRTRIHGDFWHGNPILFDKDDVNPLARKDMRIVRQYHTTYEYVSAKWIQVNIYMENDFRMCQNTVYFRDANSQTCCEIKCRREKTNLRTWKTQI